MTEKCTHYNCEALKYNQSDEVAVPDKSGRVTLLACGSKVSYESWMEGICIDCITGIKESEGEMSDQTNADDWYTRRAESGWCE